MEKWQGIKIGQFKYDNALSNQKNLAARHYISPGIGRFKNLVASNMLIMILFMMELIARQLRSIVDRMNAYSNLSSMFIFFQVKVDKGIHLREYDEYPGN